MTPAKDPTLLILAAGMGSRYGGLKQMDPVGPKGEAILDYSVFDALRAGFSRVVFVIRKQIEQLFRATIGVRFEGHIPVAYVFQELDQLPNGFTVPAGRTKPWGTTHALLSAAEEIHEPFAVINADDFYGAEAYRCLARHLCSGAPDYAMAGFHLDNTLSEFGAVARGLCEVDAEGFLRKLTELTHIELDASAKPSHIARDTEAHGHVTLLTGREVVSMNMWAFTPSIFAPLQSQFEHFLSLHGTETSSEIYLPNSINALLHSGQARVRVLPTEDNWLGVTYRDDRTHVVEGIRRLTREGRYPERLWP